MSRISHLKYLTLITSLIAFCLSNIQTVTSQEKSDNKSKAVSSKEESKKPKRRLLLFSPDFKGDEASQIADMFADEIEANWCAV